MGSVSKAVKRIIPKEIQPILPIAASMFGGPLVGSALGGIGSLAARPVLTQALASGLTSAGVDFLTSGKVDPKTLVTSTLLGGGGEYFKGLKEGDKFLGMELGDKAAQSFQDLGNLVTPTSVEGDKLELTGDILKSGSTAVTAGGSIAAYNAAEQAQRDYDEMMAGKEADAAADRQARIDFITQNMQLAGFSQQEIDDALRNAGFKKGGRVGFEEGGDTTNTMMARDDRIGTLFNLLEAERMAGDDADLDKIREYEAELFDLMGSSVGFEKGGIMNLKMGGMPAEMDLRGGGFVPIGVKEKADDVPARLSKNEFVMTADAVRAAGGGSVNKGAKKMYDLMNKLEARV